MITTFYKNDRYQIIFDMNTMRIKLIDNETPIPLVNEEIDGSITLSEFCKYVEHLKIQLNINQ